MTKEYEPLYIADVTQFAKQLRAALALEDSAPGHAKMLDLIAKAAGFRNQQARKAAQIPPAPIPSPRLERALRCFEDGLMVRWPKQTSVQGLCLWVIWHFLPARVDLSEPELNALLKARHSFGDHALLRRSLVEHGLIARSRDGRVNRRLEQRPPDEALSLIRAMFRP